MMMSSRAGLCQRGDWPGPSSARKIWPISDSNTMFFKATTQRKVKQCIWKFLQLLGYLSELKTNMLLFLTANSSYLK